MRSRSMSARELAAMVDPASCQWLALGMNLPAQDRRGARANPVGLADWQGRFLAGVAAANRRAGS